MIDPAEFKCLRCGACCRVPGYVALEAGEAEAAAAFLGLDIYTFTERYTRLSLNRRTLSLTENDDGSCVFLQDDGACRIQPVKPAQCRGFPFLWRSSVLDKTCPALQRLRNPRNASPRA
jgi:Fe-S-cluster containining protein